MAMGAREKSGFMRATMYTPAVTIVAAWISALTGVGPSIASGSQTYRGSCADLPMAPVKSSRQMVVRMPVGTVASGGALTSRLKMVAKSTDPKVQKRRRMPMVKPKSPMRVVMKAFLPALMADCFRNQKPMSR